MAPNKIKLSLLFLFLANIFTYSKAKLGHEKETKMTVYFQDYPGGPNPTVIEIPGRPAGALNFSKFGAMFVMDDPLTEAFEEGSAEIGRGRGVFVTSALDGSHSHVLMSLVFTNKKYNGSTLQIQGSDPQFEQVAEVAVVGGTGKFRLARGYATFETIFSDPSRPYVVLRCNVTVLHYY